MMEIMILMAVALALLGAWAARLLYQRGQDKAAAEAAVKAAEEKHESLLRTAHKLRDSDTADDEQRLREHYRRNDE